MSTHPVIIDRDPVQVRQPIPQTKRQKRELTRAVRHFVILEKLGYDPTLQCWCGDSLLLDYRQDDMTTQLNSFLDKHEGCEVPEVQH